MRGERIERSFAHLYETGGMRRTHLRGHENIRKRILVHAGAFNLSLLLRSMIGRGTPRGLQGLRSLVFALTIAVRDAWEAAAALSFPSVRSSAWRYDLSIHRPVIA
jgi:transposase